MNMPTMQADADQCHNQEKQRQRDLHCIIEHLICQGRQCDQMPGKQHLEHDAERVDKMRANALQGKKAKHLSSPFFPSICKTSLPAFLVYQGLCDTACGTNTRDI